MARKTYKYHFKIGIKTVFSGITNDVQTREQELRKTYGDDGWMKVVGARTSLDEALKWEHDQTKRGMITRRNLHAIQS